ncbi:MAG: GNAT family N-acetyltransferase [Chloroflexota bacterium]|nr:GNAT family N-acetyltransferase [Chloroflexota bacterium]
MSSDDVTARVERAEHDAFLSLYQAAAATCATGWQEVDDIWTVWSPHDDDPGFSCVMNLAEAVDPRATLARIEPLARAAGATVLGIDGSPALSARLSDGDLAELGFAGDYQECIWARQIDPNETFPDANDPRITRATPEERAAFARVLNIGYDVAEDSVRGQIFASTIGLPGWYHYLVRFDGEPGSASVLYVTDGVAQLFVATTMPAYRGRGAQRALIQRRLADSQAASCDLATSQTVIDNASPRNMARLGFEQLHLRWIYGKALGEC